MSAQITREEYATLVATYGDVSMKERCFQRFVREFPLKDGEELSQFLERFYTWAINMHFIKADWNAFNNVESKQ
jgi:hypothetical protein